MPHITSSRMSSMPWRSQMSRTRLKYPGTAGNAPGGGVGAEVVGQLVGNLRREEARMRIGEPVELRVHRGQHIRVRVPEARHRRPARSIDVLLAIGVADEDAAATSGDRIGMA